MVTGIGIGLALFKLLGIILASYLWVSIRKKREKGSLTLEEA
jgi:hypothetical protein